MFDFIGAATLPPPPPTGNPWDTSGMAAPTGAVSASVITPPVATAPAMFLLEAGIATGLTAITRTGAYREGQWHEYEYFWRVITISGDGPEDFASPNLPTPWRKGDVRFSANTGFVLPEGTYQFELKVRDKFGTTAQWTSGNYTVINPDDEYTGTRTICYSTDVGDAFTGAPAGADLETSWAAVETKVENATQNMRLLLKAGQTVPEALRVNDGRLTHIGTWGGAGNAILKPVPYRDVNGFYWNDNTTTQITIDGIDFVGDWDSTTETGWLMGSPVHWGNVQSNAHILIHRCTSSGYETGFDISTNNQGITSNVGLAYTKATNWRQFGTFMQKNVGGRLLYLDVEAAHHPDSLNGGEKHTIGNDHGPRRIADCDWVVTVGGDFFSNAGWSGLTVQACDRPNSNNTLDAAYFWDRCIMENGWQILDADGFTDGHPDRSGNYILDRIIFLGTARTRVHLACHLGSTTVRNAYQFQPNVPSEVANLTFLNFGGDAHTGDNANEPIGIHNITQITMRNAANEGAGGVMLDFREDDVPFNDVLRENNVYHAPNGSVPVTLDGPIDTTTALVGVTPRYKGMRFGYNPISDSFGASVPPGGSFSVPYPDRRDTKLNGSTVVTTQAEWLAWEAAGDDLHMFSLNNGGNRTRYSSKNGDFTVTFGASDITIHNPIDSGVTWSADSYDVRLDRKSQLDTDLPLDTSYASPSTIPTGRPLAGSPAVGGGLAGLTTYFDAFGEVRPANQDAGWLNAT